MTAALRPTVDWGPAKVEHRQLVDYVPGFVVNPWLETHPNTEEAGEFVPLGSEAAHTTDT